MRSSGERQTPFGTLSLDPDESCVRPVPDGEFRIFSGRISEGTNRLRLRQVSDERFKAERTRIEDIISWAYVQPEVTIALEALRMCAENAVLAVTGLSAWSSSWSWTQEESRYNPSTGQVFIRQYFGNEQSQTQTVRQHRAYHECAHAASTKGARTVIVMENGAGPYAYEQVGLQKARFTGDATEPFVVEGGFFAEAFAEETAMHCRQNEAPLHDNEGTHLLLPNQYNIQLPNKYIYKSQGGQPYFIATAAIAAHTLSRLSKLSGKDLYQLMIDANMPEKQAASQREIICAIESVEKGLYKKLRQAEDTVDSFAKVWGYVDKIVAAKTREVTEVA